MSRGSVSGWGGGSMSVGSLLPGEVPIRGICPGGSLSGRVSVTFTAASEAHPTGNAFLFIIAFVRDIFIKVNWC